MSAGSLRHDYVLALDQGTTSSRAILFDRSGRPCGKRKSEFSCFFL